LAITHPQTFACVAKLIIAGFLPVHIPTVKLFFCLILPVETTSARPKSPKSREYQFSAPPASLICFFIALYDKKYLLCRVYCFYCCIFYKIVVIIKGLEFFAAIGVWFLLESKVWQI
jgi:hypothetical protein